MHATSIIVFFKKKNEQIGVLVLVEPAFMRQGCRVPEKTAKSIQ